MLPRPGAVTPSVAEACMLAGTASLCLTAEQDGSDTCTPWGASVLCMQCM